MGFGDCSSGFGAVYSAGPGTAAGYFRFCIFSSCIRHDAMSN